MINLYTGRRILGSIPIRITPDETNVPDEDREVMMMQQPDGNEVVVQLPKALSIGLIKKILTSKGNVQVRSLTAQLRKLPSLGVRQAHNWIEKFDIVERVHQSKKGKSQFWAFYDTFCDW